MSKKGVSVYLSKADLEALDHAEDHLYTILEASCADVPELRQALAGVRAILDKAAGARRSAARRTKFQRATVIASSPVTILQTKLANGEGLHIDLDASLGRSSFVLDCGFDMKGFKVFNELPRNYPTERGARQAAALLTEEKLVWSTVPAHSES